MSQRIETVQKTAGATGDVVFRLTAPTADGSASDSDEFTIAIGFGTDRTPVAGLRASIRANGGN